jgi:hypothetical protein
MSCYDLVLSLLSILIKYNYADCKEGLNRMPKRIISDWAAAL